MSPVAAICEMPDSKSCIVTRSEESASNIQVIFDARVDHLSLLLAGLQPGVTAHILDPHRDGIAQITRLLQQHPTTALALVAHGFPGGVQLGNTVLDLNTLDSYAAALNSWFPPGEPATLTLLSCHVAAGDAGAEFVEQLQTLTQATVTASAHRQGRGQWLTAASQILTPTTRIHYPSELGTATLVADINPGGSGLTLPGDLTVFNGQLYFRANDGNSGFELWRYDGINPPTLAADIRPGSRGSSPDNLTVFNGQLYFRADDGTGSGKELWRYDGTNPPQQVADINPGSGNADPTHLTVFNNQLYFNADDGSNGTELWQYDGINAPQRVTDINPGSGNADPTNLTPFNDKLYFRANDGINDTELWQYDPSATPLPPTSPPPGISNGSLSFQFAAPFTAATPQTDLTTTMSNIPLGSFFDERYYLSQYQDVAQAVVAGDFATGYDHFVAIGLKEGRNPIAYYSEADYLANNADVKDAIAEGFFSSGVEHFVLLGHKENRDPSPLFDTDDYLLNNPDVAKAITEGFFSSGFEHWLRHGAMEGRLSLSLYQEYDYLATNPDVAAAVTAGDFESGWQHFQLLGMAEGRDPSDRFDESAYLAANPDVAAAVQNGSLANGVQHFFTFGYGEGRALG